MRLQSARYSDGIKSECIDRFYGINNVAAARGGDILVSHNMSTDSFPVMSTRAKRSDYQPAQSISERFSELSVERIGAYDVADRVVYIGRGDGWLFAAFESDGQVIVSEPFLEGAGKHSAVSFNSALVVYSDVGTVSISVDVEKKSIKVTRLDFCERVKLAVAHDKSTGVSYIRLFNYRSDRIKEGMVYTYKYGSESVRIKLYSMIALSSTDPDINNYICETDYNYRLLANCPLDMIDAEDEESMSYYEADLINEIPAFDHICTGADRVFGVCENKIYCSASCDAGAWYDYDITTVARSFFAQIPAVSRFVGITSFLGDVFLFTTEDVYRMYGSTPDTFTLVPLGTYGLEKGSQRSFAIAGQRLFYLSPYGPVCFDGDTGRLVGRALGDVAIKNAHGIGHGSKYYLSDGATLYVFDSERGVWHTEDGEGLFSMLSIDGELILFFEDGETLRAERRDSAILGRGVLSEVEFADFTGDRDGNIATGEIRLRARLYNGAELSLYISCDGAEYERIWKSSDVGEHIHTIRYAPRVRCERYRLRLLGKGSWKLYSLSRSFRNETSIKYGG